MYYPKVKAGGFVGGHDIRGPNIMKAVGEFVLKNNLKLNVSFNDWWIKKE